MYHTHFNDYAQLTAGLYGALLVIEPGQPLGRGTTDHTYVIGQGTGPGPKDPILLNGTTANCRRRAGASGSQQRVRLIGITGVRTVRVRLARDGQPSGDVARAGQDGADLPACAGDACATAEVDLSPGETWDFAYGADGARQVASRGRACRKTRSPPASRVDQPSNESTDRLSRARNRTAAGTGRRIRRNVKRWFCVPGCSTFSAPISEAMRPTVSSPCRCIRP